MLSAAHYRDEMTVIQALGELVNPSQQSSPQQIVSVQEAQVRAECEGVLPCRRCAEGEVMLSHTLRSAVCWAAALTVLYCL